MSTMVVAVGRTARRTGRHAKLHPRGWTTTGVGLIVLAAAFRGYLPIPHLMLMITCSIGAVGALWLGWTNQTTERRAAGWGFLGCFGVVAGMYLYLTGHLPHFEVSVPRYASRLVFASGLALLVYGFTAWVRNCWKPRMSNTEPAQQSHPEALPMEYEGLNVVDPFGEVNGDQSLRGTTY